MNRSLVCFLGFCIALSACTGLPGDNQAIRETVAITVVTSWTVTPTDYSAPTLTFTVTNTPMPTASPTPTFTATNTPTPKPTATPTLIPNADADDDGLANYDETVKYQTNPYLDDSDGDGISDSDWNERREYAYSVRLVMKIREPFDIETMNDLYQDARLTEGPDEEGYTLIEVVIYPDTEVDFSALPYPLAELPPDVQAYIQPGIATNYDVGIEAEVLDIVAGAETDVQVVNRLLTWVDTETTYYLDESVPEVYFTYLEDGSVRMRGFDESYVEELLRTHYFGASMFRERTHGTCTSLATLKCTILKAAGIPCRLIQTIHPIYYHEDQNVSYVNDLGREWGCVFEYPSETSASWCNHAFIEAYLGGHWIRVDQHISIYHEDPLCLNVKILSVSDWSDVDFSDTWPVDWIHDRPYYALLIEDQEQQH